MGRGGLSAPFLYWGGREYDDGSEARYLLPGVLPAQVAAPNAQALVLARSTTAATCCPLVERRSPRRTNRPKQATEKNAGMRSYPFDEPRR